MACGFMTLSTVFQLYQAVESVITKALFMFQPVGIELTAFLAGWHSNH